MRASSFSSRFIAYLLAIGMIVVIAVIFFGLRDVLDPPLIALLLLLPVGLSTAIWGLGPGISSALCAFLAFNYFFIEPYYTFIVHRPSDLVVLMVFLIVAVAISQLVGRAQAGMAAARAREREATQLYELSTALSGLQSDQAIAQVIAEHFQAIFGCESIEVNLSGAQPFVFRLPHNAAMPQRTPELMAPLHAIRGLMGEIRLWRRTPIISPGERQLLKTLASQSALALERATLAQAESRAKILEESDRFKSSLLSSVSHELRTPLATIKAAASSLRTGEVGWESLARGELLAAIDDEADHLNILVGNLLDMSRIESGALSPQRQWNILAEILESVLTRMRHLTGSHRLETDVPEDLPLVPVDFIQMEQVFTNLISNSTKYAPPDTVIRIEAYLQDDTQIIVRVSNQGPHVPAQHLERIFDKFYRITAADRVTGTGLGLSICKGIIEAHGGRIWAENLPDGFAFNFTLPISLDGTPPHNLSVEPEDL
jgi:two-component system sensor histidine kinase KdpD